MLGHRGPDAPFSGSKALFQAVERRRRRSRRPSATDVAAGLGRIARSKADKQNDTASDQLLPLRARTASRSAPDGQPILEGDVPAVRRAARSCSPSSSRAAAPGPHEYAEGHASADASSRRSAPARPAAGHQVIKVPQGIVVVEAERAPNQPARVHALLRARGRLRAVGLGHQEPRAELRPEHERAHRHDGVHRQGPRGLRARDEADRRARARLRELAGVDPAARAAAGPPSSASRSRSTTRSSRWRRSTSARTPRASTAAPAPRSTGSATIQETQDLAESLRIGALPIDLKLISQTQVSATLGKQALDQGLIAAAVGLALTILFLLLFYRVLGAVATVALLIYAVLLFALVKLIPITLTLPGIAGMVLTLAVAADANIVMFERIKEEARGGRSIPAAISAATRRRCGRSSTRTSSRSASRSSCSRSRRRASRASPSRSVSARSCRCSPRCSPRRRSSARWRARGCCGGRARSASATKRARGLEVRLHGHVEVVLLLLGRDPRGRRDRDRRRSGSTSASTSSRARGSRRRSQRRRASTRCATRSSPLGYGDAEDPGGRRPGARRQRRPDRGRASWSRDEVSEVENALDEEFGVARGGLLVNSIGPTFGEQIARTALHRGDRVAAPDLDLHRLPLRVQVRGAGADRAGARPADHRGRVRPVRAGGHDRDGRRAADDHGLLALRHGDRVRPNTRERAAHAARDLLADREPLDVRGAHAIARDELRGADAGGLAAAVRRRDAEGLRVRAARRRGVGRLLVDLHRHAGARRVEGARARLHAPPPHHARAVRRPVPGVRAGRARRAEPRGRRRRRRRRPRRRRRRAGHAAAAGRPRRRAAPAPPAARAGRRAPPRRPAPRAAAASHRRRAAGADPPTAPRRSPATPQPPPEPAAASTGEGAASTPGRSRSRSRSRSASSRAGSTEGAR